MQVKVPKFIDVEDRVVLGLTWKQFVYLSLAITFTFVVFSFFDAFLALPLSATALSLAIGLAFAKVNDRPFKFFLASLWRFNFNPRRYGWEKAPPKKSVETKPKAPAKAGPPGAKHLTATDVRRIATALNIHETAQAGGSSEIGIPRVRKIPPSARIQNFQETLGRQSNAPPLPSLNDGDDE